ncbi:MAG: Delta-aminolevulinic acid dehydratase [Rhodospirillaceae bacterium]|nr:MAG: Delta-aminolevulinic acid dehydratase [Rhodospirillaceae bacterium]
MASFPRTRMRRNRASTFIRSLVAENRVTAADLILPLFLTDGVQSTPVASMPGVSRNTIDDALRVAEQASALGIPALALFPEVDASLKTPDCAESWREGNLINRAVGRLKQAFPDLGLITDVALDPYNPQGHDGYLVADRIVNDETIEALVKQALSLAHAGTDIVAPSDMMDGRIGVIRDALDAEGFTDVGLMSYAVKYASAYYGPFRDAIGSGGALKGDKKTYQMDTANALEGLREVELDIEEGADTVMVKPGLPYLDMVCRVKETFGVPTFAYQVSGEYAAIMAAAENGWLDHDRVWLETLLSFKRAGADGVLTYGALKVAGLLAEGA